MTRLGDDLTPSRRAFLRLSAAGATLAGLPAAAQSAPINRADVADPHILGPVLGHIDDTTAHLLCRPARAGAVTLILEDERQRRAREIASMAQAEHDYCVSFALRDLTPGTAYRGVLRAPPGGAEFPHADFAFRTAPSPDAPGQVTLGFGSCVSSTDHDDLWRQIAAEELDGFCFLGDTPYIDTSDLAANRRARRVLWGTLPSLGALARKIPFWNTWDDHDFGQNDSDGRVPMKENIRRAFLEYNALASYGEEDAGIYTRFRRGPIETWLIDARWFSQTARSWADPAQPTCLGERQWRWLQRTLRASTAPFKLLCTGMVWYAKGNREKDHWETYAPEREALFAFLKREKITGVVLLSGDIHVSRHHTYDDDRVGYPLHECVISPLHASVIPALDIPHPARVWSRPEPHVFLKITAAQHAAGAQLTAAWRNRAGATLHTLEIAAPSVP